MLNKIPLMGRYDPQWTAWECVAAPRLEADTGECGDHRRHRVAPETWERSSKQTTSFESTKRAWTRRKVHTPCLRRSARSSVACSPSSRTRMRRRRSARRNLTFDSALLSQPVEMRARVIVEKLVHLKVPNHGKLFKALVKSHLAQGRGRPA